MANCVCYDPATDIGFETRSRGALGDGSYSFSFGSVSRVALEIVFRDGSFPDFWGALDVN